MAGARSGAKGRPITPAVRLAFRGRNGLAVSPARDIARRVGRFSPHASDGRDLLCEAQVLSSRSLTVRGLPCRLCLAAAVRSLRFIRKKSASAFKGLDSLAKPGGTRGSIPYLSVPRFCAHSSQARYRARWSPAAMSPRRQIRDARPPKPYYVNRG